MQHRCTALKIFLFLGYPLFHLKTQIETICIKAQCFLNKKAHI